MARETGRSTLAGIAAEAGVSVSAVSKVLNGRTDVAGRDPGPDRRAAPAGRLPGRLPARLRRRGPADRHPAHPVGRGTAARHGPGRGRGRDQRRGQHRGLTRRLHGLAGPGHGPRHRRRAPGPAPAGQQRAAAAGRRAHPAGGDRPAGGTRPGHPVGGHHELAGLPDRDPAPDRAGAPPHRDHRRPGAPVVQPRPAGRLPRRPGGGRSPARPGSSSAGTTSAPEGGRRQARDLLALAQPPTAIVAGNDAQAFGVLQALGERGLRAPGDLSVVGFDDVPVASWATPALTTVRQPLAAMAATAFRMLHTPGPVLAWNRTTSSSPRPWSSGKAPAAAQGYINVISAV